jgi:hypothetical protein
MQAIKDYENNKWKVIGQKLGKPAKVRHFRFTLTPITHSFIHFSIPMSGASHSASA